MNPNPLGCPEEPPHGTANGVAWTVILDGSAVAIETPRGSTLIFTCNEAQAIEQAINAALPHMAQKIEP